MNSPRPALEQPEIHEVIPKSATAGSGRRHRVSHSRLTMPLPPYDIRVRREIAHRRTLVAISRDILRIVSLHLLDGCGVASAVWLANKFYTPRDDFAVLPLMVGLILLGLEARGAYRAAHGRRDGGRIATGVLIGTLGASFIAMLSPVDELSLVFLGVVGLIACAFLLIERWIVDAVVRLAYSSGVGLRRALVLGSRSDWQGVVSELRRESGQDHLVVGFVVSSAAPEQDCRGCIIDLEAIIRDEEPAELILCAELSDEAYRRVADICVRNGVSILAMPPWAKQARGWAEPTLLGQMPGFWLHPVRLEVPSLLVKRVMDLVITSILLVVAIPLIGVIGALIKIESRGPVFFRQRRVGLGGREFTMWKFRSMHQEAERNHSSVAHLNDYSDQPLFKMRDDPRITRVGKWLRRFSLDELPQLFNVLTGDMSLVGPRPPLPSEVTRYEQRHFVRLTVVPGMTGPWQVGGRNLITDFEEVVRLERTYIEHWSYRLDLKIMARTIGVMLSGEGAY
jgi:exopolysaccharide biosynthesis polyprenyl glycosylphosphotransferase